MSSTAYNPSSAPTIFSIPSELLEFILILCAVDECPGAISAFAQTCRFLRALIYDTPDTHLWREIFLATFDDPRPILEIRSRPISEDLEPDPFDWQGEFVRRIFAKKFIHRYATTANDSEESESPPDVSDLLSVVTSLVSVVQTALPFPKYPKVLEFMLTPPPTFAPLVLILSAPTPHSQLASLRSKNARWIANVLRDGLPRVLTKRLIGSNVPSSSSSRRKLKTSKANKATELEGDDRAFARVLDKDWDKTPEGRVFYKLLYMTGFSPCLSLSQPSQCKYNLRSSGHTVSGLPYETQMQMARGMARSIVYSIPYLSSERCWGPFLTSSSSSHVEEVAAEESTAEQLEPELTQKRVLQFETLLNGVLLNAYGELNSDDDDADYEPPPPPSASSSQIHPNSVSDDEEDEFMSDDEDLPYFPAANLLYLAANEEDEETHETYVFPPYPHQVIPDYAFLASARLIIEENLRSRLMDVSAEWAMTVTVVNNDTQTVQQEITSENPTKRLMDALRSLETLRMGAAPGFWGGRWRKEDLQLPNEEKRAEEDKPLPENQKEGYWDWAGVEGQWRRCVCWMDYRDLLFHNLRSFRDGGSDIRETLRIFPMMLRVVGYEDPPAPPSPKGKGKAAELDDEEDDSYEDPSTSLVYRLPIICVEGEARGSDMDETAVRKVKGTVRMIGDGAVRWSLTSSEPDGSDPEWVTECVQIGSIGSAIGFIGLWTGAGHARSDPIGPTWAWRVA